MYGTGMPDIKYVPHRDAVQIRLEGTEMPYIFMTRGCQGMEMPLYIYGTGMPRHGDALYIYKSKSIWHRDA